MMMNDSRSKEEALMSDAEWQCNGPACAYLNPPATTECVRCRLTFSWSNYYKKNLSYSRHQPMTPHESTHHHHQFYPNLTQLSSLTGDAKASDFNLASAAGSEWTMSHRQQHHNNPTLSAADGLTPSWPSLQQHYNSPAASAADGVTTSWPSMQQHYNSPNASAADGLTPSWPPMQQHHNSPTSSAADDGLTSASRLFQYQQQNFGITRTSKHHEEQRRPLTITNGGFTLSKNYEQAHTSAVGSEHPIYPVLAASQYYHHPPPAVASASFGDQFRDGRSQFPGFVPASATNQLTPPGTRAIVPRTSEPKKCPAASFYQIPPPSTGMTTITSSSSSTNSLNPNLLMSFNSPKSSVRVNLPGPIKQDIRPSCTSADDQLTEDSLQSSIKTSQFWAKMEERLSRKRKRDSSPDTSGHMQINHLDLSKQQHIRSANASVDDLQTLGGDPKRSDNTSHFWVKMEERLSKKRKRDSSPDTSGELVPDETDTAIQNTEYNMDEQNRNLDDQVEFETDKELIPEEIDTTIQKTEDNMMYEKQRHLNDDTKSGTENPQDTDKIESVESEREEEKDETEATVKFTDIPQLPMKMILDLFVGHERREDISNLRLVSKHVKQIVDTHVKLILTVNDNNYRKLEKQKVLEESDLDMYVNFYYTKGFKFREMKSIVKRYSDRIIYINGPPKALRDLMPTEMPNLETFNCEGNFGGCIDFNTYHLPSQPNNLKSIMLYRVKLGLSISVMLPHLKELSLAFVDFADDDALACLLSICSSSLQEFEINNTRLDFSPLGNYKIEMKKLTTLSVAYDEADDLTALLSTCSQSLESLTINAGNSTNNEVFTLDLPKLKNLHVRYMELGPLLPLLSNPRGLKVVELEDVDFTSTDEVQYDVTSIKDLDVELNRTLMYDDNEDILAAMFDFLGNCAAKTQNMRINNKKVDFNLLLPGSYKSFKKTFANQSDSDSEEQDSELSDIDEFSDPYDTDPDEDI